MTERGSRASNVAAVLHGVEDVRIEEREVPSLGSRDVLIEVVAVGVCGSDVHYYEHGRIGDFVVEAPLILGHECSGRVVAVGPDVANVGKGDRVAIEPGVPCSSCRLCRSGHYNLCPDVRFLGTPPIDGALVRYLAIHSDFVFPLPDSMSYEAATLAEPLSVAIWANRRAGTRPGDRVLVTGAGPIGLVCAAVAQASGARSIVVSDVNPDRLARATEFGATTTVAPEEVPKVEADVLLECSGAGSAILDGLRALAPAGRAVLIGMSPSSDTPVPIAAIQNRELELTGSFRYANTYPAALDLLAAGLFDTDQLISIRFPLEQAEQALTALRSDGSVLKPMVVVGT